MRQKHGVNEAPCPFKTGATVGGLPQFSLPRVVHTRTWLYSSLKFGTDHILLAPLNKYTMTVDIAKHEGTAGKTAKRQAGQFYLALSFVYSRPVTPEKTPSISTFSGSREPPAGGSVERDGMFGSTVPSCVRVCACEPPAACCSVTGHVRVSAARSNSR